MILNFHKFEFCGIVEIPLNFLAETFYNSWINITLHQSETNVMAAMRFWDYNVKGHSNSKF